MSFDQTIAQVSAQPCQLQISSDWMQGRAAFGGIGAAVVYESMRQQLPAEVPVRCLQIAFVGPVTGEPLEISSRVLRQGKSVSQVMGSIEQEGQCKLMVQGAFGAGRESAVAVPGEQKQGDKSAESLTPMPYIAGVLPAFTQHFDFRYITPLPFAGTDTTSLRGYVCFKEGRQDSIAHLLALVDAWPPTTLPLLNKPAPASSLTWTVEFMQPQPALKEGEFTYYEADIVDSHNGYGHTRARIWNSAGELLAISQQTVTHFA